MYSCYIDDHILYSPVMVDEGYVISEPVVTHELNKAGSFEFTICNYNDRYAKIYPLRSVVYVKEDEEIIWKGRVLNTSMDFYQNKKVYCEGMFSCFLDSVTAPYKYKCGLKDHFEKLINNHNSMMEDFKKFKIGNFDIDDIYGEVDWEQTDFVDTLTQIEELPERYGGYLMVTWDKEGNNIISYVKTPGSSCTQTIEFGRNLMDVTCDINPEDVFTVLYPVGYDADDNPISIASVNDGKDYIFHQKGVETFGKIVRSYTFEFPVTSPQDLLDKAKAYLNNNFSSVTTLTIKAIDLHLVGEKVESFKAGNIIKVVSKLHGIDEYEICTKTSIDLQNPENSEYTIGPVPTGIVIK